MLCLCLSRLEVAQKEHKNIAEEKHNMEQILKTEMNTAKVRQLTRIGIRSLCVRACVCVSHTVCMKLILVIFICLNIYDLLFYSM